MKVEKFISELLYEYDCVIIPDLGAFILNPHKASFDPTHSIFMPPRKEVVFNSLLKNDDGVLLSYISEKNNISYAEAKQNVDRFVENINERLNLREIVFMSQLGTFIRDAEGNVCFNSFPGMTYDSNSYGFGNFTLPEICSVEQLPQRNTAEHISFGKVLKYSVAAAAILLFGVVCFRSADIGLKTVYHAGLSGSLLKNDVKVAQEENPSMNPTSETQPLLVDTLSIETPDDINRANYETAETPAKEALIPENTSITTPKPISEPTQTPTQTLVHVATTPPTGALSETTAEKMDAVAYMIEDDGIKMPYIIVASCPDYDCAKTEVDRLRRRGYDTAAIINSDNRYRVTVSSSTTRDNMQAVLEDARANVATESWVLFY
ncbi:MAG: SPOR domain-containing protein [Bacteroidales bacterium]|nr:SPOR domain-containing protein [Bacteroidales bacterium]